MRLTLVTDSWSPQVNGVVRTLKATIQEMTRLGHHVTVIEPSQFKGLSWPAYPDIKLSLVSARQMGARLTASAPDAIHIAVEGPLGLAARRWCVRQNMKFTTAYHTRFPEFISMNYHLPEAFAWAYMRWFHGRADKVLAPTTALVEELTAKGLRARLWGRGVNIERFNPDVPPHPAFAGLTRPILLSVGRVSREKNLDAFLSIPAPGTKVVVGDGPDLERLRARYPDAIFLGRFAPDDVPAAYVAADAFVFPSTWDTFGLVLLESLACGTPVAAYPSPGPNDLIRDMPGVGAVESDLAVAIQGALAGDRTRCRSYAETLSWTTATQQFLSALTPCH